MTKDYPVGYKRPPRASQWKAGQSGNPRGRTKGARNLRTELGEEMAELILVHEQGRTRKISKQRALIKALAAKSAKGDVRALALILNMLLKVQQAEPAEDHAPEISAEDAAIVEALLKRHQAPGSGGNGA